MVRTTHNEQAGTEREHQPSVERHATLKPLLLVRVMRYGPCEMGHISIGADTAQF